VVGVPLGETTRPPTSVTVPAMMLLTTTGYGLADASTGIDIVPDAGAVYDLSKDILFV
jgi:hypothetical protein